MVLENFDGRSAKFLLSDYCQTIKPHKSKIRKNESLTCEVSTRIFGEHDLMLQRISYLLLPSRRSASTNEIKSMPTPAL